MFLTRRQDQFPAILRKKTQLKTRSKRMSAPPQADMGDIAEYLGMHSFYDDLSQDIKHKGLFDQPIRTLAGKVTKPTRILQSGAPVQPELNGVYDRFLRELNNAGIRTFQK